MLENGKKEKLPQEYIDAFKEDIIKDLTELYERDTDEENIKCFLSDEELNIITDEIIAYLKQLI